ncbi:MAG: Crp/Fnr family transcriptional regulator [Proteobacteria bacterium]|jgi:CRP-like cAMP-binding protein|nr:Crp/Fnr family transcriptional regulator [Pseudomonadota bacterium]
MNRSDCEHRKTGSCLVCPSRDDSIFSDLQQNHLDELDHSKVTNLYKKGQVLFHEGSPALGVYCVLDGQVKILKNSEDGKETITRLSTCGDVLGLRGVLTDGNYHASAKVMQDSNICFIDRKFFKNLIMKSPEAANRLILQLAKDVTKLEEHVDDMTNKNVRQRLTHLLLGFCHTYGIRKSGEVFIDLKITRAEMASMIGTSPETVIRFLSELDQEGLVRQDGKKIFIPDMNALADEAGVHL